MQSEFFDELKSLEEKSISVSSDDEIRDRIDSLFQSPIGSPPGDQKFIGSLFSEGENRYKNNIPPGYKDSSKDDKNSDELIYSGITYKRKVWRFDYLEANNQACFCQ